MTLRIVSPTTVADSRVLSPQEYIYDNHSRMLYVLNDTQWFCYLQKKGLLRDFENKCVQPELIETPLYEWLKEKLHRRGFDVESELGTAVKYKIPAESKPTIKNKKTGKKSLNKINLCMRLCDGRVYIPGSTIKGVIRTAILFHSLSKKGNLRKIYYRSLKKTIDENRRKEVEEIRKIELKRLTKREKERLQWQLKKWLERDLELELKKLIREIEGELLQRLQVKGEKINNVLRDAMRGIRCSDAMLQGTISTRVVQKIDFKLKEGAYNTLPIYKEMIEPGATFSFTITLEPSMTKTIGIERVEDIIECLQYWFDKVTGTLSEYFQDTYLDLFKEYYKANCMIGGNTNFLYKVIFLAFTDDEEEGEAMPLVKRVLDRFYGKHLTDNIISPRTLKGTSMNGTFYMTGEAEIQIEE